MSLPARVRFVIVLLGVSAAASAAPALRAQTHVRASYFDFSLNLVSAKTPLKAGFLLGVGLDAKGDGLALRVAERRLELTQRRGRQQTALAAADLPKGFWRAATRRLTVSARPRRVFVAFDGRRVLAARVDKLPGDGLGVLGLPKTALAGRPRIQRVGRPSFNDRFDTPEAIPNTWRILSGKWKLEAPVDPLIALNENTPMYSLYTGGGAPALAMAGRPFWDFYSAEVTCGLRQADAAGLVFYWTDPTHYASLTLERRGKKCAAVLRCRAGDKTVEQKTQPLFDPAQWHRLRVEAVDARMWAYVDGRRVLAWLDQSLRRGAVGLIARGAPAAFDDVDVEPFDAEPLKPGRPFALPADWPGARLAARAAAGHPARLLLQAAEGAQFEATLNASGKTFQLVRRAGGRTEACGTMKLSAPGREIELDAYAGRLEARVDGRRAALWYERGFRPARVEAIGAGGPGSWARVQPWRLEPALVEELPLDMPEIEPKGVKRTLPLLGTRLRVGSGAWAVQDGRLVCAGEPGQVWYAEPCPNDARASVDVLAPGKGAGLRVAADADVSGSGYAALAAPAGKGAELRLLRNRQVVARRPIPARSPFWPRRLFVERYGPFVAAGVDGRALIVWRDPRPLPGARVALVSEGGAPAFSDLRLENLTGALYRFEELEPAWRQAGGRWTLHSGMSCIPWDNWITGDGRNEPAVMWLRRPAPGDVAVRFDVCEFTLGTDDPNVTHYHFPYHDITLAVCADGKDLRSGYAVEIGADGGACLRVRKQGNLIFETYDFTIKMGSHCNSPRQVRCYFRKRGGELTLWINGRLMAKMYDDKPLAGGYIGLSAKDCRANFSDVLVMPDTAPPAPKPKRRRTKHGRPKPKR